MFIIPFNKQWRMKHRIRKRIRLALRIRSHLASRKSLPSNHHAINNALYIAPGDEDTFRALFNENIPSHYKHALSIEIGLWIYLRNALETITRSNISSSEYEYKARALKGHVGSLIEVMALQIEILSSPLVQRFETRLKEIEANLRQK